VKHLLFSVTLLAVIALAACSPLPAPETMPVLPTDTPKPPPTPVPQAPDSEPVEPADIGGVDVALTLVTIPDDEIIATVNGEEINTALYQEELERTLNAVTDQYMIDWNDPTNLEFLPGLQEQVLDQIIGRILLHQLADQEGVTVTTEQVEAEIATVQEQVLQDESIADWDAFLAQSNLTEELVYELVTDDLLMQGLAEQFGGPNVAEYAHAAHILVETEEIAQEVLDKLDDGEDFAALAAEYSMDPGSKDQGGDLDWFSRGMMVPVFEDTAFSLEPGETSGMVQSDFGFHIIHVFEKEEREMDPAQYAQQQQQDFQIWFEAQKAEADIERAYTFQESESE